MSNLSIFNFNSNSIRVIADDPINPLFVAFDVAKALGYSKPENAVARFCKKQSTTPKQGGGFLTIIPEPDLYRLIFGSKLKSAQKFQDWVFEEVLPQIRKTGKYDSSEYVTKEAYDREWNAATRLLKQRDEEIDRLKSIAPWSGLTSSHGAFINRVLMEIEARYPELNPLLRSRLQQRYQVRDIQLIPEEMFHDAIRFMENFVKSFLQLEQAPRLEDFTGKTQDEDLVNLLAFIHERIEFIENAEKALKASIDLAQPLLSQVEQSRYKTRDLKLYLKIHGNRLKDGIKFKES